jgi:hypothetical protein
MKWLVEISFFTTFVRNTWSNLYIALYVQYASFLSDIKVEFSKFKITQERVQWEQISYVGGRTKPDEIYFLPMLRSRSKLIRNALQRGAQGSVKDGLFVSLIDLPSMQLLV